MTAGSKNGVSGRHLHRMFGVNYRTAWFPEHRIRECMKDGSSPEPLGGPEKFVEADVNPRRQTAPGGGPILHGTAKAALVRGTKFL